MMTLTLSRALDDVQSAEHALHRLEQRYWLSLMCFILSLSLCHTQIR